MGQRDQNFVRAIGVPVAQLALALGKSRQTVNRGIHSPHEYLKPADLARMLETWKRDPGLRMLARDAVCGVYPDMSDAVLRASEAASSSDFVADMPGEYWFVCGDLMGFRTNLSICSDQLDALCGLHTTQVKLFVSEADIRAAKRIEERHKETWTRAIRCDLDLTFVPSTLLRIDIDDNIDLFGASESGFSPLSRGEAARLRLAIHDKLLPDAEKEAA